MRKAATPIIVACVLILSLVVGANAQAVATNFNWVVTKLLTVTDAAQFTSSVSLADTLTVSGASSLAAVNATGNISTDGNLTVAGTYAGTGATYFVPPTALTVTDGSTITVTGTVLELTSAGAVGADLPAATDGRLLILVNVGSNNIVISDTATIESAGDITLGATDSLTLIGSGIKWYELAASNN